MIIHHSDLTSSLLLRKPAHLAELTERRVSEDIGVVELIALQPALPRLARQLKQIKELISLVTMSLADNPVFEPLMHRPGPLTAWQLSDLRRR